MNVSLTTKSLTLAANGVVEVNLTGSFLLFVSNTGNFQFSLDGGPLQNGFSILSIDVSQGENQLGSVTPAPRTAAHFNSIILKDTSGASNTITFIVANYPVTYANPVPTVVNKDASTYIKATNGTLATTSASSAFNGVDSGHIRRQFVVTNENGTNVLQVLDSSLNRAATIQPGQSFTVASNGTFYLNNPSGTTTITYSVLETFYS